MEDATENKNDVVVFVTKNITGVLQEVHVLLVYLHKVDLWNIKNYCDSIYAKSHPIYL